MASVLFHQKNSVGLITLNKPQQINACDTPMCQAIWHQLAAWEVDPSIELVIIRGEGEKGFCAGGDIKQVYYQWETDPAASVDGLFHEYRLNQRVARFKKPYLSFIHGLTMGGGVGVSWYARHRVGSPGLSWAMPEVGIGFFPDVGASYFFPQFPGYSGFYLGLTGYSIVVEEAFALNVIDYIMPKDRFEEVIQAIVEDPKHYIAILKAFHQPTPNPAPILEHLEVINDIFSTPSWPLIQKRLQTHPSDWAKQTLERLLSRCPLSVMATAQHLYSSRRDESLEDCLKRDFILAQGFLREPDFQEGIRAAVIDKDHQPCWRLSLNQCDHLFTKTGKRPLTFESLSE